MAAFPLFRQHSTREAAELAFQQVVEWARLPVFFTAVEVPDTLDGRFELLCLHAFLYLHRLKREGRAAARLGQAFFDRMFADLDRALRDLGTGDLRVGREVKRMARGFYGRIRAYEVGLAGNDAMLAGALARNLYGTSPASPDTLAAIAAYLRREAAALALQPADELLAGRVRFGAPC